MFVHVSKMDAIGPRGSAKLLWQLSRVFFRCACQITMFLLSGSLVKVHFGLPGASWRLLAAGWLPLCAPGCPWVPLLPPGGPWRPLAAPGGPRCPLAFPGGSWRLLAPPGCPWRLLAVPGDHWLAPVPGDFLAGPQHSHSRCDFQVFSLIQARGWRSKFAFWLRFPSVFCDSSVWLALKIRILVAIPKCFL